MSSIQVGSASSFLRKRSIAAATGAGCETKRNDEKCILSVASGKRSRTARQSTVPSGRRRAFSEAGVAGEASTGLPAAFQARPVVNEASRRRRSSGIESLTRSEERRVGEEGG